MRTPGAYPLRVLRGLVPGRNKLSSHISTLSLFLSPSLPPSSLLLNHPVHTTTTTTQRHSNGHSNFSPARVFSPSRTFSRLLSLALSSPSASYGAPFSPGTRFYPPPSPRGSLSLRETRAEDEGSEGERRTLCIPHTPPSYASSFSFPPPPPSSRRLSYSLSLVLFHASRYSRFCRSRRRDYAYWRRRPALLPVNEMFCIRRR